MGSSVSEKPRLFWDFLDWAILGDATADDLDALAKLIGKHRRRIRRESDGGRAPQADRLVVRE
jgi:hypothetical protein